MLVLAAAGWLAGWLVVLLRLADAAGCCWLGLAVAGCSRLVLVATLLLLLATATAAGCWLLMLAAAGGLLQVLRLAANFNQNEQEIK